MLKSNVLRAASSINLLLFATVGVAPTAKASSFTTINTIPHSVIRQAATPAVALPPGFSIPDTAVVASEVQAASSWKICIGSCASGKVPTSYKMTQHVTSASINGDGTGTTFHESGTTFGDVMWNHTLNSHSSATHFVMDMYIKVDHPENVQALEIALLKRDGSYWYKGSTQCNYRSGQMRGYNVQSHSWNNLGAACVPAKANTWQRLTLQYSIVGGHTNFEAVSFDNVTQPTTASLPPQHESTTSQSMGVHFQLDNANTTSGYTVSVDNWTVYSW